MYFGGEIRGNQIGLWEKGGATGLVEMAEKKAETEKTSEGEIVHVLEAEQDLSARIVGEWLRLPHILGFGVL